LNRAGNAIQVQLDKKGIRYRRHDNAFVEAADPEEIKKRGTKSKTFWRLYDNNFTWLNCSEGAPEGI
jgi:hypothetical protein